MHVKTFAAIAVSAAFAASAQEVLPEKFIPHELPEPGMATCYPVFGYCVTRIDDTIEARRCLMQAPRAILGLREQVKKLEEIKGCAKVEVTEPSKTIPPIPVAPGGKGL